MHQQNRQPLDTRTNPANTGHANNQASHQPFNSYQPNKSGFITTTNERSDFSHFLPTTHQTQTPAPQRRVRPKLQKQNTVNSFNQQNKKSRKKSRSNEENPNQSLDKENNFFSASLQRFNSMTVPFMDSTKTNANANNKSTNSNAKNEIQTQIQKTQTDKRTKASTVRQSQFAIDRLPIDYCLKKRLHIVVQNVSLKWCQNVSSRIKAAALHPMLVSQICTNELEKRQLELYSALKYSQYPANTSQWFDHELNGVHTFFIKNSQNLSYMQQVKSATDFERTGTHTSAAPQTAIATNSSATGKSNNKLYNKYVDKMHEWIEAFHSVYYSFIHSFQQHDHYIYIDFTPFFYVIFYYNQFKISVAVTNTYESFRDKLTKANIKYRTPLLYEEDEQDEMQKSKRKKQKQKKKKSSSVDMDDDSDVSDIDLEEMAKNGINIALLKREKRKMKRSGMLATSIHSKYKHRHLMNTSITTLIIDESANEVHKFFDFFLNYVPMTCLSIKRCHNLPVILSNHVFVHSQLKQIKMSKNLHGYNDHKQQISSLELNGYIMPHSFRTLCKIFCMQKEYICTVKCDLDEMCYGLDEAINHVPQLFSNGFDRTYSKTAVETYEPVKKWIGISKIDAYGNGQMVVQLK